MICLLAVGAAVQLGTAALTLAWTHSVEKVSWEESWEERPGGLALVEMRVRGSGAGMEPGPDAHLIDGVWISRPKLPLRDEVVLRRSGATADWRICVAGACSPMSRWVGPEADPIVMTRCREPAQE